MTKFLLYLFVAACIVAAIYLFFAVVSFLLHFIGIIILVAFAIWGYMKIKGPS
jgi:hypothetical protein